jgi:phage tail sheath protein FI
MLSSYKTPGVYINEISKFPPNVAQVETAIPVFIGYTHLAEKNGIDITGNPVRINSLAEYETYFGSINTLNSNAFINPLKIIATVSIDVNETNKSIIKISVELDPNSTIFRMYYSLKLFYDNGGGACYIVSAGKTDQVDISNA